MVEGEVVAVEPLVVDVAELNVENAAELIIEQWLETSIKYRNATIEFAKIMIRVMDEFTEANQTEIWKKVKEDNRVQDTVISLSRAWDATRLLRARRDLLEWTPEELVALPDIDPDGVNTKWDEVIMVKLDDGTRRQRPHLKQDGTINWEFYLRLYRYKLTEVQRIGLENQAKLNGWTVRQLNERIKLMNDAKNANLNEEQLRVYRQRKGELIRQVQGLVASCTVRQIQSMLDILRALEKLDEEVLDNVAPGIVETINDG